MKIIKYPDGSSYAKVDNLVPEFTFRINSYEDLWHLQQIIDVYVHNNIWPTVIIPNLFDAQADRRFNKNESHGLKLVCGFLTSLHVNFKIFHPHNPEVVEAAMDNVEIIDNSEFIKKVILQIEGSGLSDFASYKCRLENNLILMSSDAGGFKPLMKLCDKIKWQGETFSASKSRQYIEGKSKLIHQIDRNDFGGKDILIIDDICVYGGTFIGLAKLLRERNCGKLYLAVSHMTVQNLGQFPITDYFDKVFTTNSKYDEYKIDCSADKSIFNKPKNLQIIKMF